MEPLGTLGAIDESQDDTLPTRFIGRYRLLRELASGGMASVHLASSESTEGFSKLVAIKLIHEHLSRDQSFVDMFLDEARIAARIDHANVCSVFDFGQCEGTYFIAMEYLVGETFGQIRDAVKRRGADSRWPLIAASLTTQACEGLHAAHELSGPDGRSIGLVHRDVSPHNLFVTYGGLVKVVDFGIARAEGRSHHTTPGTLKGKFAYMAPEQLTGGDDIDRRADVWALGVTLWELLTLRTLFRKSSPAETLSRVLSEDIRPPSELQSGIPAELDAIVLRALARSPERRYASARAFGRDLAQFCRANGGLLGPLEIEEWLGDLSPENRRERLSIAVQARESQTQLRPPRGATSSSSGSISVVHTPIHGASGLVDHTAMVARTDGDLGQREASGSTKALHNAAKAGFLIVSLGLGALFAALYRPHAAPAREAPKRVATMQVRSDVTSTPAPAIAPTAAAQEDVAPSHMRAQERAPSRRGDISMLSPRAAPDVNRTPTEESATTLVGNVSNPAVEAPVVHAVESPPPAAVIPAPASAAPTVATATAPQPPTTPEARAVPPAPAPAPTFEAQISFRSLNVRGSLPATSVRATLDRSAAQLRSCYREAARAAGRDAPMDVGVRFAIDETGAIRSVSADGGGPIASCVQGTVARLRPRERPDIGFIQVSVTVHFAPVRGVQ